MPIDSKVPWEMFVPSKTGDIVTTDINFNEVFLAKARDETGYFGFPTVVFPLMSSDVFLFSHDWILNN